MTAIPAAKVALVAMLQARLPSVQVQAGLPAEIPANRERVYVDAAIGEALVPGEERPQQEAFAIQVVIETDQITGDDPAGYATAEARKWVLYRELERLIAADDQLGVAVWGSYVVVVAEVTRPTEHGWFGQVLAAVHCHSTT